MTILGREWIVEDFVPLQGRMLGRFLLRMADDGGGPASRDEPITRERRSRRLSRASGTSG